MELNFPDKVNNIYQMTPEVFDDYIKKYYIKENIISSKTYSFTDHAVILNFFRYVYKVAKQLDDTNDFKKYALSICHRLLSRVYIWDHIPQIIKDSGRKHAVMIVLFDIVDAIDHITNLHQKSETIFQYYKNIDMSREIFELCIDDYINMLTIEATSGISIEDAARKRKRDININTIVEK